MLLLTAGIGLQCSCIGPVPGKSLAHPFSGVFCDRLDDTKNALASSCNFTYGEMSSALSYGAFSSILPPGDNSKSLFGKLKWKIGKIEANPRDLKASSTWHKHMSSRKASSNHLWELTEENMMHESCAKDEESGMLMLWSNLEVSVVTWYRHNSMNEKD